MTQKLIDFRTYSSLKIGSQIPVSVIEISDVGCTLASSLTLQSLNPTHKLCESQPTKKPKILHDATLTCHTPLPPTPRSFLAANSQTLRIIGRANNLLVSPTARNLAVLGASFNYIACHSEYIEIGASVASIHAFSFFKQHNLAGLEFLKNLPGNIGALCNMNAGMKQYEIAESLHSININGEWLSATQANLLYRTRGSGGVIFAARFHKQEGFRHELLPLFTQMRATHPKEPSCGSCFKNPPNDYAGRLLELAGMKGFFIQNVGFSEKHANFLVNKGGASFTHALEVITLAKQKVYDQSGILLECEVQICE